MEPTYLRTERNKFLCVDCSTFDEYINNLEKQVEMLKEWKDTGKIFLSEDGISDDYATFYTKDCELAEKWNFYLLEDEEEDNYEDEECECMDCKCAEK